MKDETLIKHQMTLRFRFLFFIILFWLILCALTFFIPKTYINNIYFLLGIVLILNLILWWITQNIVAKRLAGLNKQIVSLGAKGDFSKRLSPLNNDALVIVISKINELMNIIEESHEKLEQRVAERTQELQESNIKLLKEMSERKTAEKALAINKEQLSYVENFDILTDLPNRSSFGDSLNQMIISANANKKIFAILILDLDRFKNINDEMGHVTGDEILKLVAARLKGIFPKEEIVGRLGGDEFAVVTPQLDNVLQASQIAQKILNIFNYPFTVQKNEFYLSGSIGICIYPKDAATAEKMLKNADIALYRAKESGGSTFHYYTNEMERSTHNLIALESNLRKALTNGELTVYYQPIVNLPDKTIASLEVLIRWYNPEYGFIQPKDFIPVAEETGLILQLGEFVLREACIINKMWQDEGYMPVTVAVNLSPIQFRDNNLVNMIQKVLKETALDPKYLEFELTENAVVKNDAAILNKIKAIHNMGIKIAIDDFGTGYSSMSYLKQFPIQFIKIDQSFIKGIPDNQEDVAITRSIISLAHNLGFKVIAEGVETEAQLNYLIAQNCDLAQGYIFSKPMPKDKIRKQFFKIAMT